MEALEDWSLFLHLLEADRRVDLYNLSSVVVGAELDRLVDVGLAQMLRGYVRPVADGSARCCLRSADHRELIQLLVKPDGQLGSMWRAVPAAAGGGLAHWEARDLLLRLANTVEKGDKSQWRGTAFESLQQDLQDLAAAMEEKLGPAATWHTSQAWFIRVLNSGHNSQGCAATFYKELATLQPWQVVTSYLCMLCNCLAHHEEYVEDRYILPQPGQLLARFTAEEVDLVDLLESCPFALCVRDKLTEEKVNQDVPSVRRIADVVGPILSRYVSHAQAASATTSDITAASCCWTGEACSQ